MKPEDDPEARIRELERPLAETARVSETGFNPPPAPWASPRVFPRLRLWLLMAGALMIALIGVVAALVVNFAGHRVASRPNTATISPATPNSPPGNGIQAPDAGPSTPAPPGPTGANLSMSGISENRTIACNESNVNVSGVSNTVVITGHCASLSVSGVQNNVTVDAVDTIDASGFSNQIVYHAGSPSIDRSGERNMVRQG